MTGFGKTDKAVFNSDSIVFYSDPFGDNESEQVFLDHVWLGVMLAGIEDLVGLQSKHYIDDINLKGDTPEVVAFIDQHFACPVKTNCHHSSIRFSSKLLTLANPRANADIHQFCLSLLNDSEPTHTKNRSCTEQVNWLLRSRPHIATDESAVADHLLMSKRSLRRALTAEGVSFSALRNEVLLDTAKAYLTETRLTIADIADLLGYAEPTGFTRAFRQWCGIGPKQFRLQLDG